MLYGGAGNVGWSIGVILLSLQSSCLSHNKDFYTERRVYKLEWSDANDHVSNGYWVVNDRVSTFLISYDI